MTDVVRYIRIQGELAEDLRRLAQEFQQAARLWQDGDPPHVWLFDLRSVLDSALPHREAERSASRTVLTALIAAYAAWMRPSDTSEFRYIVRPGGKPKAVTAVGARDFHCFNLSHSAGMLAIAIAPCKAREREVGVDLEIWSNSLKLSRDELRQWTRQEAAWKCIGTGMTTAADSPDVVAALNRVSVEELGTDWVESDEAIPQLELTRAWNWQTGSE